MTWNDDMDREMEAHPEQFGMVLDYMGNPVDRPTAKDPMTHDALTESPLTPEEETAWRRHAYSDSSALRRRVGWWLGATCARYFGSDGTLCSTHNGRFADDVTMRCEAAVTRKLADEGMRLALTDIAENMSHTTHAGEQRYNGCGPCCARAALGMKEET